MFYVIISIISVILAAICGYLYATIKALRSPGTFAPVAVPPVAIRTPEPVETPAPDRDIIEPVKVAEPVAVPESPKPVKTPSPKSAPKAAEPKAAAPVTRKSNEGKKEALPLPEGAPAKPVRSDYPDTDEGLASYKYDVHQYWNKVTALRRKAAKSGTDANAAPKAEPKPEPKAEPVKAAPKAETKPEPVATETKPEPKKAAKKTTEPKVETVETTKAETVEAPKAPESEPKALTKKSDYLVAIIDKVSEGCTLEKEIVCSVGKGKWTIVQVTFETSGLMFHVKECDKSMKASLMYFSTATCKEILNTLTKKAEAPKAEVKESAPKDVQPMSDNERYAQNQAEAIVRTLNNKNIQSVTFTDSIVSIFTDPKTKKEVEVEITGLRRTDKGDIYITFAMANNKVGRFEIIKGAYVFNLETLRTIQKQINDGAAKKKNANARVEYMKSVAA